MLCAKQCRLTPKQQGVTLSPETETALVSTIRSFSYGNNSGKVVEDSTESVKNNNNGPRIADHTGGDQEGAREAH